MRQRRHGAGGAIQLPAAVVRHHDAIDVFRRCALGVFDVIDTLEDDLAAPAFANPLEVFPVETLIGIARGPRALLHRVDLPEIAVEVAERMALADQARPPAHLRRHVPGVAHRHARWHDKTVLVVGMALAAIGKIDGEEQRAAAGVERRRGRGHEGGRGEDATATDTAGALREQGMGVWEGGSI